MIYSEENATLAISNIAKTQYWYYFLKTFAERKNSQTIEIFHTLHTYLEMLFCN